MLRSLFIFLIASLAMGALLAPLSRTILEQEKEHELLPSDVNREDVPQQLALVTLGGLRSLSAAILSIEAFESFLSGDWKGLEHRYNQIFALAPHHSYYWDTAAWHLAYNAASSEKDNPKLSPQEQRYRFINYIKKGKDILKKGIEKNPENWTLYSRLGALESDSYRLPDYVAAADAFHHAAALGAPMIAKRQEFYALAHVPARSEEAWKLGRELFFDNAENRVPSLITSLYALEYRLHIPEKERIPFDQLFRSPADAQRLMKLQLQSNRALPIDGLQEYLDQFSKNPH